VVIVIQPGDRVLVTSGGLARPRHGRVVGEPILDLDAESPGGWHVLLDGYRVVRPFAAHVVHEISVIDRLAELDR
jgi:hypothetical protein